MKRYNGVVFSAILTLTVVLFLGQLAFAGPGCKGLKDDKSCQVKSCDAKATCAAAQTTSAETKLSCCADGKKCTKEECIKKCLEQGLTQAQAEECWAKHQAAGTAACTIDGKKCTKEECIKKCLEQGMTQAQAEECWAKHQQSMTTAAVTTASATSGCPMMAQTAGTQTCTKEQCIAKLTAEGLSKEEAEAKYAACHVDGKCTGKCTGASGGCAKLTDKK